MSKATCSVCNSKHDCGARLDMLSVCRMCWLTAEHRADGNWAMFDEAMTALHELVEAVEDYCSGILSPTFEAEMETAREVLKGCPCGKCKPWRKKEVKA